MCKSKLFINGIFILMLVLTALGNTTLIAQAEDKVPNADPNLLQLANEHPDYLFPVIVQKDLTNKDLPDDDPEVAVEKANGKVNREKKMDFIASFSADLTGREIEKLAKNPKVRWVSLDAPLFSTAVGDLTVRDEFTTAAYTNNNGTQTWASNWAESGDGTVSATSGYALISNGSLLLSSTNRALSRQANLSGVASARLTFQYKRSSFDSASDYVLIQASATGGSPWTELGRITGPGSDSSWQTASFNILSYGAQNTRIRIATSSSLGTADILSVDNVQIVYTLPETGSNAYTSTVGANELWSTLQGQGVTVAIVDSGVNPHSDLQVTGGGNSRLIASTTVRPGTPADDYGHGSHVAGVITGNGNTNNGVRKGVAPGANLINVKVSDSTGMSLGSDLIAGLQWIYDNKATYNIKVVNISLNSTVAESYHTSPINAAVEILWFNGIVVVVSAGNNGGPGAIYPPANDPFVITVGAADDMGTASLSDDVVTSFSAYGTTESGFAKPELVAPGRNLISLNASTNSNIYNNHATHRVDNNYFRMSGTSMSAPVVTGAVALLLQDEPTLNPDQVKYRLMSTANKSWAGYNATTAGAGYLDIYAAVNGTSTQAANTGILASNMLATGSAPVTWNSVGWNSVGWNSVGWNSVGWNTVGWNSVGWNSVGWNTDYWGP